MALWTYLNAYVSSIPASQRQRLLNLLYTQVKSTQLPTVADYEAAFQKDITALNQDPSSPTFNLITQNYRDITNSANFNAMEGSAISNLQTLYAEALLLENVVSNHVSVVDANLSSIAATVADLSKRVDQLELLAMDSIANGYITSFYDSFNVQDANRLVRTTSVTTSATDALYFTDPVLGYIQPRYDAYIDQQGFLRLPVTNVSNPLQFNITFAYLENQVPPGITAYEKIAAASGLPTPTTYALSNLISPQTTGSYWAETVDVPSLIDASGNQITSAETDLIVGLGGVQQINNLQITPFTYYPYMITDIQYVPDDSLIASNGWIETNITTPIEVTNNIVSVDFPSLSVNALKFHIVQNNYSAERYFTQPDSTTIQNLYDIATGNLDYSTTTGAATVSDPNGYYFAMTSNMQNLLGIDQGLVTVSGINGVEEVDTYEFMYGMENIAISQLQYDNLGIYVSKPFVVISGGAMGLNVIETIPELTAVEYHAILEYQDYVDGVLSPSTTVQSNILPSDVSTISNISTGSQPPYPEILDGEDNTTVAGEWSGYTRFPVNHNYPLSVYQQGNLIGTLGPYPSGLPSPTTGIHMVGPGSSLSVVNADLGSSTLGDRVWFNSADIPNRNSSYFTVAYTPIQEVSQIISMPKHDQTNVTLQILLRSMTPNQLVTPLIGSYALKFKIYGVV